MVKITLKNISSWVGNDSHDNPFVTSISEKSKIDISFNKFLSFVLKQNILIFEKNIENLWTFKSKQVILNQIDKCIVIVYNDHIINITKIQIENDSENISEIKQILDKLHLSFKKKLTDFYDLKNLLNEIDLDTCKLNQPKKKKIINNDIYIEEFSN